MENYLKSPSPFFSKLYQKTALPFIGSGVIFASKNAVPPPELQFYIDGTYQGPSHGSDDPRTGLRTLFNVGEIC